MVDILSMVDLTSISAILAAIGVFVGVVFAVLQLRDLVKTRQTDLVVRLYSSWSDEKFMEAYQKVISSEYKDYNDYVKKYGEPLSGTVDTGKWLRVGMYFEGIGVLLRRKLIDIGLVDDLFTGPIKIVWEKMKPVAEGWRKELNLPTVMEYFEYLYNEMKKREQTLQSIE